MVLFDKVPLAHYIANIWQRDVNWEKHNPKYRCLFGQVHVVGFEFAAWAVVTVFKLIVGMFDHDGYLQFYYQAHHEEVFYKVIITCIVRAVVILIAAALFWRVTIFHTTRQYLKAKAERPSRRCSKVKAGGPGEEASGTEMLMRSI
ncbi:hypothetical protein Aduo_012604 [Ancylostoma duodenale]